MAERDPDPTDQEFEEVTVKAVKREGKYFAIERSDGWHLSVTTERCSIEPKPGEVASKFPGRVVGWLCPCKPGCPIIRRAAREILYGVDGRAELV